MMNNAPKPPYGFDSWIELIIETQTNASINPLDGNSYCVKEQAIAELAELRHDRERLDWLLDQPQPCYLTTREEIAKAMKGDSQ